MYWNFLVAYACAVTCCKARGPGPTGSCSLPFPSPRFTTFRSALVFPKEASQVPAFAGTTVREAGMTRDIRSQVPAFAGMTVREAGLMPGCAARGYCSCALHHCLVLPPMPVGWPGTTSIDHRSCPAWKCTAGAAIAKYTLGRVTISSASVCVSAVKRHLPCYGHSTTAIAAYIYTSNASVIQALLCTNIGGICPHSSSLRRRACPVLDTGPQSRTGQCRVGGWVHRPGGYYSGWPVVGSLSVPLRFPSGRTDKERFASGEAQAERRGFAVMVGLVPGLGFLDCGLRRNDGGGREQCGVVGVPCSSFDRLIRSSWHPSVRPDPPPFVVDPPIRSPSVRCSVRPEGNRRGTEGVGFRRRNASFVVPAQAGTLDGALPGWRMGIPTWWVLQWVACRGPLVRSPSISLRANGQGAVCLRRGSGRTEGLRRHGRPGA